MNSLSLLELRHPSSGSSYLEEESSRKREQKLQMLSIRGGQVGKHGDERGWGTVSEGESTGSNVGQAKRTQTIESLGDHEKNVREATGGF